ncbi:YceI family protein [uncultured Muriicola sp.]|uniref:YceI family protein n=1 Tax=uncultured Muriicola sp. TaxID=1583102 RepID=UPI0026057CA5|nr:YceI family protein [uncultured Muriicola sp.]
MSRILLIAFLFSQTWLIAQESYLTQTAVIRLDASTPLEDIKAVNENVNTILKTNGEIASLLLMKEFDFEKELMEEHFNENYVESDRFPKAYFIGKIQEFSLDLLTSTNKQFLLQGSLSIHGVTNAFETMVQLRTNRGNIELETSFIIRPEDYKVKVPRLLFKKIAQEILVTISANLIQDQLD